MDEIQNQIPPAASASAINYDDKEKMNPEQAKHVAFASLTPEKTALPVHTRFEDPHVEINPMCKDLIELFDFVTCSMRLLTLRKKPTTFKNVSLQVELLTKRDFSFRHLAQIKYIFDDALQVDTILVHDKSTLCMKPELKITLVLDVVKGHHEESDFLALHQIFGSRLAHYFTMNPEAHDIPEATLPHPFDKKEVFFHDKVGDIPSMELRELISQNSGTVVPGELHGSISIHSPLAIESETLSRSSHICPSSKRSFCQKMFVSEQDKIELLASPQPLLASDHCDTSDRDNEVTGTQEIPVKDSKFVRTTDVDIKDEPTGEILGTCTKSTLSACLPVQIPNPKPSADNSQSSTPQWKIASSADGLAIETPAQSTPRRAGSDYVDNQKATGNLKQTSSCKPAKRSLDFSFTNYDEPFSDFITDGSFEFPCDHVTQTQDGSLEQLKEVKKSLSFTARNQNQLDSMQQEMSVSLTDLVSLINQIFYSVNYSPITKEELFHKIIVNSFDFVDKLEVEECIGILENLVPDWICRKITHSGDTLYNIKKTTDLSSVQTKVLSR